MKKVKIFDIINNNEYYVGGDKVINSGGTVSVISGFGYNIKTGVISNSRGTVLVTAITSNNTGTTTSNTTGYTFNSGCTSGYGYYIGDINGTLYYTGGTKLLSGNTIYYNNGDVFAKYNNNKICYQLINGYWIYTNPINIRYITGYTNDFSTTAFTIGSSSKINADYAKTGTTDSGNYCIKDNSGTPLIEFSSSSITSSYVNKIHFKKSTCSTNISAPEIDISDNLKYTHGSYNIKYNSIEFCKCSSTLTPTVLILTTNYYYLPNNKIIQYGKTSSDTSMPQAVITATTIGISGIAGYTHISAGTINYYSDSSKYINLLNCKNGVSSVNTGFTYNYKNKSIIYDNKLTIASFVLNYIYKSTGVEVLNLVKNNIINSSERELVSSSLTVDLGNRHTYYIKDKRITGSTVSGKTINYDLKNNSAVTISGTVLDGMGINSLSYDKNTKVTTCRQERNEIFKINSKNTGSTINLDLSVITGFTGDNKNSEYKLTATTSNDKVRIVTGITISANNHTYTWKENDKYINVGIEKDKYEKLTNNNKDRLFYYCNKDGEILYNGKNINYVIDEKGEYWDLTNGKKIIIKDTDSKENTTYINLKNKKAVPPRNKIKDKYGNIKINKGKSYNSSNKTYRDKNNRIINETVSGSSQYSINEIYCTTAVSLNDGYIYDSNGRALMKVELNKSTVFIEGGLKLVKSGENMAISDDNTTYVTGITSGNIGGLTKPGENNKNITITNNTYYYKGKKLYDKTKGAYYFEEAITGTANTGFTLQNRLIVSPLNNNITGYTSGVTIKNGSTTLVTISKKEGKENEYTYNIADKDIFIDKDGILLYKNIIIADVNNGIIYNMREPSDLSNIPDTSFIAESGTNIIIDETGNDDDYELEDKDNVYYDAHHISEIKKYIPDLSSYIFKCNNSGGHKLNVKTSYMGVMEDEKEYYIVDGGKNNSSYKIKVEPQFITQNMINNRSTIKAYIVNNNGDQIPHSTYTGNGYNFKYTTDASNSEKGITADTFIYTLSTATPIFNEIKFSLHCNNDLVNQEIVEVLGENKFITSVEYINNTDSGTTLNITPTVNAYYNENIDWAIEKGLDDVEFDADDNTLTISSGVTGTVVLSGSCKRVKVYEKTVVITKNGEKGEQGISGATGNPGPRGKLLYPAGVWDSRKTYDGTDTGKTPFVMYKDKYWVLTATTAVTGVEPLNNSTAWTEMEQYEAIYTKLLVAENGLVGGSVYNGDYVFSKSGVTIDGQIINPIPSSGYSGFTTEIVDKIFTGETVKNKFIPNYLVDFKEGRAWFGGGKTIIDKNGVVYTKDIVEMIQDFLIPDPSGSTGWNLIKTGFTLTDTGLTSDKIVCIKNIDSLNSYLFDDNFGYCPGTPIILHYYIPDHLITRPNIFYKGEIYIGNSCASLKYISFPGQTIKYNNRKYGEANSKTFGIHVMGTTATNEIGGNKIEFLVKWDGKSTIKIKKAGDSFESTIKKLDIELIGKYEVEEILRFI